MLLLAIVAAVALTLRRRKGSKYIAPAAQVRVKSSERIRLVSMTGANETAPLMDPAPDKGGDK